jgi:type VI protein secretion system component VasA
VSNSKFTGSRILQEHLQAAERQNHLALQIHQRITQTAGIQGLTPPQAPA